jgi:SNF2 family DNA or RNA helicase
MVYHGYQRQKDADLLRSFDVVLTTYETVRAEYSQELQNGGAQSAIQAISWTRIVLDEGELVVYLLNKKL